MSQIKIVIGTTNIKVFLNKDTPRPIFWTIEDFCKKKLRLWEKDYRSKKWKPTKEYYRILPGREGVAIPATFLGEMEIWLGENGLSYSKEVAIIPEPKSLDVKISEGWTPYDYQQEAVDYLTRNDVPRHGLNADTGDGKTCMSIFTVVKLNVIPLIVLPGQVLEQWPKRIKDQLEIDDDDIYLIKGFPSLQKLWKKNLKPKLFIASISTMRPWVLNEGNYKNLPSYEEFIEEFGIGVKISDEAHMHFATNVMLDLSANIRHNIYLTATFKTGNPNLKKIFDRMYPEGMKYVPRERAPHVHITEYGFAGSVPPERCVTNRGYNHAMYEQHLLKYNMLYYDWLRRVLLPIIDAHYTQKKVPDTFKCIVFCRTVDFITKVTEDLQTHFPNKKVRRYVDRDPDSVLDEAQVIVSTFGSCGTGKDIKNLYTVLSTVSFKAPTLTLQVMGRLRELSGYNPEYVEAFDTNIPSCVTHWKYRSEVYKVKGKTYKEYRIR